MTAFADGMARFGSALSPMVAIGSVLFGLVLAGTAASLLALARAKAAGQGSRAAMRVLEESCQGALGQLRASVVDLESQIADLRREAAVIPPVPRPGFNLNKRSQALRLYRHGVTPRDIAAELGIPISEVDLLLKVHRIVIRNL